MTSRNPAFADMSDDDLVKEVFARNLLQAVMDDIDDFDLLEEIEERGLESRGDADPEDPQPSIDADRAMRAYRALTPTTPEPIRELVLELAGRIA